MGHIEKKVSIGEFNEVSDEVLDETKYKNYDTRINSRGRKEVYYGGTFISKYHPKLLVVDVLISLFLSTLFTFFVFVGNIELGLGMQYHWVFIPLFITFMYVTRRGYGKKAGKNYHGHIGKNALEDGGDKKLVGRFKTVYLMGDNSIKFGYELVNLDKSTTKYLVVERDKNSRTLLEVETSGNEALTLAIKEYVSINMLSDEDILKVLSSYHTLKKYDEDKNSEEYFKTFLGNKEQIGDFTKFNLDSSKQLMIEDMEEIRLNKLGNLEENKQLINKIKEKVY